MKYKFVLRNAGTIEQGWWLKVATIDELNHYMQTVKHPLAKGFLDVIDCREFFTRKSIESHEPQPLRKHVGMSGFLIGMHATNKNLSAAQAVDELAVEIYNTQLQKLKEGYFLYFNKDGGWCFGDKDYDNWCENSDLVFPEFKRDQIHIERFPMGHHYYAFVDNVQVHDGDKIKWNSYEEAYEKALEIIRKPCK